MPALTPQRVDEYLKVAFGAEAPRRRADVVERLRDPNWAARRRYVCDAGGPIVAVAWLVRRDAATTTLVPPRSAGPLDERSASLIDESLDVAFAHGARRVDMRIGVERCSSSVLAACRRTGAEEGPGRAEFEGLLSSLPRPAEGDAQRLVFAPATDETTAAEVLARCAVDSPDALPGGRSARTALRRLVGPGVPLDEAVHLGRLASEPVACAIVCTRIEPPDGWSTIRMLALEPRLRGRGLGPGLHRRGLAMLRARGARIYRGGTSLDNRPMMRCFAVNRVPEAERFREFRWINPRPPGGSS